MTHPVGSIEADKNIDQYALPDMGWLYLLIRCDPNEVQAIAEQMPNEARKALLSHIDLRLQHDDRFSEGQMMTEQLKESRSTVLKSTDL